jgi:hypothetical protein
MTKEETNKYRKFFKWFLGLSTAVIGSLIVFWITQKGPISKDYVHVDIKRVDYEPLDFDNPVHEIVCFIENDGNAVLNDFSMMVRVWSPELISCDIDMYGDPEICTLENIAKKDIYNELKYKCLTLNPGESMDVIIKYDVSYSIKKRWTYVPAKVQIFIKTIGFTHSESYDSEEVYPSTWR